MSDLLASVSFLVTVFVVVTTLVLSFVVIKSDPKGNTNRIFLILGIVLTIWALIMHRSLQTNRPEVTLFLAKFSLFWGVCINTLFLLLAMVLFKEHKDVNKKQISGLIFCAMLVMGLTMTKAVFQKVTVVNNGVSPIPGPGMVVFAGYIVLSTVGTVFILLRRIRHSKGVLRKQLFLIFFGMCTMLGLIIFTIVLPVAIFRYTFFIPFFPLYSLFFTGFTAYAIVRHRLFNTKVIATEAISVVITVILFAKLVVEQNAREKMIDGIVLGVIIIFGYQLIRSVMVEVHQKEKLEELTGKLKALDKQKDEFISMAAHELRAPMTAIKGFLSMIAEGDVGKVPPKMLDFVEDAMEGSQRLINLVNNMLNISRIEEGRMVYSLRYARISNIVSRVYSDFELEAKRKGLNYSINKPEKVSDLVYVDEDRVCEVVTNLVSNAIKYTDNGYVIFNIENPDRETVRCSIKDSGRGITKEEQEKIFKKFARAQSSVGKTIGTGLGLYISKLIVEKFDGKIGLVSEYGKGSTFWFELPLAKHGLQPKPEGNIIKGK